MMKHKFHSGERRMSNYQRGICGVGLAQRGRVWPVASGRNDDGTAAEQRKG